MFNSALFEKNRFPQSFITAESYKTNTALHCISAKLVEGFEVSFKLAKVLKFHVQKYIYLKARNYSHKSK